MKLTTLTIAATRALEAYEAGDLRGALSVIEGIEAAPLPERPEWIAHELERRAASHDVPCAQAAMWSGSNRPATAYAGNSART